MKTGVYDISMQEYLAAHGVNQSSLKLLARSPAHAKYALEHPEEPTREQNIGTVAHVAVFEPTLLDKSCYVRPKTYPGAEGPKEWQGNSNWCKKWLVDHRDKPVLTLDEFSRVEMMRASVMAHPAVVIALEAGGKFEQSLFCEDPETGLQLKCRIDYLPNGGNAVLDMKTTDDASPTAFARKVANFGYDVQAAFDLDICNLLGMKKERFIFIVVEKDPPFAVAVYSLEEESINVGRNKYRRLLGKWMQCAAFEQWPGYSRNIERLNLPKWAFTSEFEASQLEDRPAVPALEVA